MGYVFSVVNHTCPNALHSSFHSRILPIICKVSGHHETLTIRFSSPLPSKLICRKVSGSNEVTSHSNFVQDHSLSPTTNMKSFNHQTSTTQSFVIRENSITPFFHWFQNYNQMVTHQSERDLGFGCVINKRTWLGVWGDLGMTMLNFVYSNPFFFSNNRIRDTSQIIHHDRR